MNQRMILQVALAKGVGDVTLKNIIKHLAANNLTWDDLEASPDRILPGSGLKPEVIHSIYEGYQQAQRLSERLEGNGIRLLLEDDLYYPSYMKRMLGAKCPPILFVKGNASLLNSVCVGFCGSRKVSQKGADITANCAAQFAKHNITVVSGYASGTDMAAHKSSLLNGGNTVFVLAEGLLHAVVKTDIKGLLNNDNHVFISQFMPQNTWNVGNAMRRNSVIIGLSRAMVLVESGKTGGTFAAGEESLRVGCPLFVIDFAKPEVSAEANPYFLEAGGKPIRGKNGIPSLQKVFETIGADARSEIPKNPSYTGNEQLRLSID